MKKTLTLVFCIILSALFTGAAPAQSEDDSPQMTADGFQVLESVRETKEIAMRLEWFSVSTSQADFMLCYPKPDTNNWEVWDQKGTVPMLLMESIAVGAVNVIHLCESDRKAISCNISRINRFPEMAADECCARVSFKLTDSELPNAFQLVVPALYKKQTADWQAGTDQLPEFQPGIRSDSALEGPWTFDFSLTDK